jgi:HSP20 family protein
MSNWKLFREMDHFRKEMDELFRGLGNEPVESAFLPGVGTKRFPRINLGEDADNLFLEALLPGIDEKEIDLSITGNTLTLSGERQPEFVTGGDQTWHRRERGFGKFMRTIELPAEIDTKAVTAEYRNGILKVSLGKAEAAKPKRISIASH